MAEVKRTGDHSIWFNHKNYRQESAESLFESLSALKDGQQIALVFNGVRGMWARYKDAQLGLRPVDESARQSWRATSNRCGDWFPLVLPPQGGAFLSSSDNSSDRPGRPYRRPSRPENHSVSERKITLKPTKRYARASDSTLCLGLDLTWWGGSRAKPDSQNDTLSYVMLGKAIGGLKTQRVSLAAAYDRTADKFTANCDAHAEIILTVIDELIKQHKASQVIVAIDAPLLARARDLPQRSRCSVPGALSRREPEQALARAIAEGPPEWRVACNIQPGAPVCSRVKAFVDGLVTRLGFNSMTIAHRGRQRNH